MLEYVYLLALQDVLGSSRAFLASALEGSVSLRGPGSVIGEWHLGYKTCVLGVLAAPGEAQLQGPLQTELGNMWGCSEANTWGDSSLKMIL